MNTIPTTIQYGENLWWWHADEMSPPNPVLSSFLQEHCISQLVTWDVGRSAHFQCLSTLFLVISDTMTSWWHTVILWRRSLGGGQHQPSYVWKRNTFSTGPLRFLELLVSARSIKYPSWYGSISWNPYTFNHIFQCPPKFSSPSLSHSLSDQVSLCDPGCPGTGNPAVLRLQTYV